MLKLHTSVVLVMIKVMIGTGKYCTKSFMKKKMMIQIDAEKQEEIHDMVGRYGVTGTLAYYQQEDDDEAIYYISLKYFNS